jgi:hypothetical protein
MELEGIYYKITGPGLFVFFFFWSRIRHRVGKEQIENIFLCNQRMLRFVCCFVSAPAL